jgi:UDP-glucose 4-epimerase
VTDQQPGDEGRGRRVLVTGAAGFIGRHLVAALARDGSEVTALTRGSDLPASLVAAGVRTVRGDLADGATVDRLIAENDAVCHLAAWIPPDLEDPGAAAACLEQNALGALRIAEAVARASARLVFFSSGQVYGPSDRPLAEDAPTYPAGRATYYLASKLAGELFVEHQRLTRGLSAVTLRVGSCFGYGMPAKSVVARFLTSALTGLPLEVSDGGAARYDFVSVADVVDLTRAALNGGETGVFNAGAGRGETVLDLVRAIERVFDDRRLEVRIRPPRALGTAPGFAALATDKARAAWGYRPRDLIDALRAYRADLETPPW